jgi:hypothetical protein
VLTPRNSIASKGSWLRASIQFMKAGALEGVIFSKSKNVRQNDGSSSSTLVEYEVSEGLYSPHGSIHLALPAPGAVTHTHAESPTTHVSPMLLPDIGNISVDGNLPLSRAETSSPYGIIIGRSSPIRHCGRRTRTARGGGSLISVARGAYGADASSDLGTGF